MMHLPLLVVALFGPDLGPLADGEKVEISVMWQHSKSKVLTSSYQRLVNFREFRKAFREGGEVLTPWVNLQKNMVLHIEHRTTTEFELRVVGVRETDKVLRVIVALVPRSVWGGRFQEVATSTMIVVPRSNKPVEFIRQDRPERGAKGAISFTTLKKLDAIPTRDRGSYSSR